MVQPRTNGSRERERAMVMLKGVKKLNAADLKYLSCKELRKKYVVAELKMTPFHACMHARHIFGRERTYRVFWP